MPHRPIEEVCYARNVPLLARLFLAIVLGSGAGVLLGPRAEVLGELGVLVVRMLKALATPLVFVAVVDSLARAPFPAKKGAQLLGTCLINTAVAGAIALGLSSLMRPGAHAGAAATSLAGATSATPSAPGAGTAAAPTMDLLAAVKGLVPESIAEPFVKNEVLAVVVLAVLTGAALRHLRSHKVHGDADSETSRIHDAAEALARLVEGTFRLLAVLLHWIVQVVPFAIFGVVAKVVGTAGFGVFASLGLLVLTVATGLLLQVFGYYSVLVFALARISPLQFFRAASDALVTALSTGSSMATLPVTLRTLEGRLGVSHENARLAACVGTNFNNDGIMLYEVVAALFVAQVYGIPLGAGQQISLAVTSAVAAAGIAGVPEAGLITLSLVLASAKLPLTALPLLLTVDWLLGRLRAATNVASDLTIATVLDRFHPLGTAARSASERSSSPPAPGASPPASGLGT